MKRRSPEVISEKEKEEKEKDEGEEENMGETSGHIKKAAVSCCK